MKAFWDHTSKALSQALKEAEQSFYNPSYIVNEGKILKQQEQFKNTHLPQEGDEKDYIARLYKLLPGITQISSPCFIGHMTARLPGFMPKIAHLVTALNQNVLKTETSAVLTLQEKEVIAKMHRQFYGFSDDFYRRYTQDATGSLGFFTSGGTLSNLNALYIALNQSASVEGNRLKYWYRQGVEEVAVIGSESMHYSFDKACNVLGLKLLKCPVDKDFSIDIAVLEPLFKEAEKKHYKVIALIGTAGSTDCGAIDDLLQLSKIAQEKNIHFHVDGAWGGAFILSEHYKERLKGIENADTITMDGHKQLLLPMGSGMLFFKTPTLVQDSAHFAPYAVRKESKDLGRFTLEGSRAANGLYLEAALMLMGQKGISAYLEASVKRAEYFAHQIQNSTDFQLITWPQLNMVLYRYVPSFLKREDLDPTYLNRLNTALQQKQKERGKTFVSRTERPLAKKGRAETLLRAVLLNPISEYEDLDAVLADQRQIGEELIDQGL